jgi:hypothetical protein
MFPWKLCFVSLRELFKREKAPKGMSPKVFPNLKRTHKYENLPLQG